MQPARSTYLKGALCGLAAVAIWAGWSALTRLAVTTGLDAWDVAALRFGIAGVLLAPVVARHGLARDRLGWSGLGVLIAGVGAPYVLVAASGLRFAPARDQGALNPGAMPLFVALLAAWLLGERFTAARAAGLGLILTGALAMVGWHASTASAMRALGDALFLVASFLTACFTVVVRRAQLMPLHATALVSTGSLILYLPVYLACHGIGIARAPFADVAMQAAFQGVLVTIVSLVLYGRAIALLGASGAAAFGALVPALSALLAIPLLGEWPDAGDWLGIALISAGVYLASGAPLASRNLTPPARSRAERSGPCRRGGRPCP
ncbi:MAG TPA: DMT family transporter [Candidatus Sulfotelmatobacter sp.]|nr:DMT family transporter [Candidatus Sulfotelmatobacter sp.]